MWHKLRDWDVDIILTVHDSIVMEVGPDVDMEELRDIIARAFTTDVYNYLEKVYGYSFVVPLGAEIKVGERWGQGEGRKVMAFPNDRNNMLWKN